MFAIKRYQTDISPNRSFALRHHPSSKLPAKASQCKRSWRCSCLHFWKRHQIDYVDICRNICLKSEQKFSPLCHLAKLFSAVSFPLSLDGFMISRSSAWWELRAGGWLSWLCVCACMSCVCFLMDTPSWSTSSISRVINGLQLDKKNFCFFLLESVQLFKNIIYRY